MNASFNIIAQIRIMAAAKLSARQIAASLNVTRNSVIGLCRRNSIQLYGKAMPYSLTPRPPRRARAAQKPTAKPKPPNKLIGSKGWPTCCWFSCVIPVAVKGSPYCPTHGGLTYDRAFSPL